jgi:predicted alpha-1,2-mannosidase
MSSPYFFIKHFAAVLFVAVYSTALAQGPNLVKYVNPLSGTATSTTASALKHGTTLANFANTIPSVCTPFAMTQWTPQTQATENKCIPPYYYKDDTFSGFRGSHWLSGSCTQDYGSVSIMPITGKLRTTHYAAKFSHADEFSTPYLYSIDLKAEQLTAAVTASPRCGIMQFTINKSDSLYLLITPNSDYKEGYVKVDAQRGEIYGYNPAHRIYQGWGQKAGFNGYFVIRFQKVMDSKGTFAGNKVSTIDSIKNLPGIGAYVGFKMAKGEKLTIRIGTSFTGLAGARKNIDTEMPVADFDAATAKCKAIWQKSLSQIQVKTSNEQDKNIFYTAYYHAMQHPRLYNDVDGLYPEFSANYKNAVLKQGNYYDDFSMWDIYRAEIPLFEILKPAFVNNLVQSLILKGKQGGWMPIFPCWNSYTSEMIGDHTGSVISSAYLKGIRNYNIDDAYQTLRHNAFELPASRADYVEGKGRRALDSYLKYHYIPLEDSVKDAFHKQEQVSRTIEYAYDDYALAQFAKALNKAADYNALTKRAGYYANVFDTQTGMVRGRHADGSWATPFDPDKKGTYITEGTARQYTFYVPHDVAGLSRLMGGANKLENALDSLFIKNEYWHGNEPGHQIPFMYNYTPSPWKTQQVVRKIMAEEYSNGPGGLGGNDDAGQMSAWYMFAALGFYPVNPISGEYLLCSPIFDSSSINLNNGKVFKVIAHKTSGTAKYIHAVKWNSLPMRKNYITYSAIMKGGTLDIYLQDTPDKQWGAKPAMQPL